MIQSSEMTRFAWDAILPLVRPTSYVVEVSPTYGLLHSPDTGAAGPVLHGDPDVLRDMIEQAKQLEADGYEFRIP